MSYAFPDPESRARRWSQKALDHQADAAYDHTIAAYYMAFGPAEYAASFQREGAESARAARIYVQMLMGFEVEGEI